MNRSTLSVGSAKSHEAGISIFESFIVSAPTKPTHHHEKYHCAGIVTFANAVDGKCVSRIDSYVLGIAPQK